MVERPNCEQSLSDRWVTTLAKTLVLITALLILGTPTQAQVIRGELIDEISGDPLLRAFVMLRDTAGAEQAWALTDYRGRFVVVAPGPGLYRLQTAIVGWKTWTSPLWNLTAADTITRIIDIPHIAVRFDTVVIEGTQRCETDPADGFTIAQVWYEARKALSAVHWTSESGLVRFERVMYEQEQNRRSFEVTKDERWTESGVSEGSPFVSAPATKLSRLGYIHRKYLDRPLGLTPIELNAYLYYAPDADVLLSDVFATDHCFFLAPHEDDAGLIGLAFEPMEDRRVAEIRGVLWIDRWTAELRYLDYGYTRLPWAWISEENLGGRVDFEQLADGGWIVRRWSMRMPIIRRSGRRRYLHAYEEIGGFVTELHLADGSRVSYSEDGEITQLTTPTIILPPIVDGKIEEVETGQGIEGAGVYLVIVGSGTVAAAISDDSGRFELRSPIAGTFELLVRRIGYRPVVSEPMTLEMGQNLTVSVGLRLAVIELDPVVVEAHVPSKEMAEFERRRRLGMSRFSWDSAEIEEMQVGSITEVIGMVPGARVLGRSRDLIILNSNRCRPTIYIDGYKAHPDFFSTPLLLDWIYAIEVFRTASNTPVEFRDSDQNVARCGTILVWTVTVGG